MIWSGHDFFRDSFPHDIGIDVQLIKDSVYKLIILIE